MRDTEHRAAEAQRLLGEPLLNEALAAIERDAVESIVNATTDLERFEHTLRIKLVREIPAQLQRVVLSQQIETRPRPGVA